MKGEKMVRKISLAEFKNNVLLFPYLKKEDKTSEQFNFALDEIEKQNSIYIGKEKKVMTLFIFYFMKKFKKMKI